MQVRRKDVSREIELRGTASELSGLAELVRSGCASVQLDSTGDPSPYDRKISRVTVVEAPGPVVIQCSADSDTLYIRGGSVQLGLLAINLQGFACEGDVMSHLHIDYFPGHDYLDGSSESLVVAVSL